MPRLTEADLAAIEAREQAATPGPWWVFTDLESELYPIMARIGEEQVAIGHVYLEDWDQDHRVAQFIAHARQDVPALLAEVRRLRAALQRIDDLCPSYAPVDAAASQAVRIAHAALTEEATE